MTYTRIRNQEFSIKIKPLNSSPNILYTDPDKFYNDVESFLKQKYPNQFSIKSQEKVGIEYFTKKLIEGLNFTFVKYGDGEIICMIGGKEKTVMTTPTQKN